MLYKEFLEHIYRKYSGNVKLELDRMEALMAALDHPELSFGGLHIAGTNGKGSVCAGLEALSLAFGRKTGLNTSPHLIDYTERFRINGKDVDYETILAMFLEQEALFEKWDASFFEISTCIAFLLFARSGIQTGVIEVGLGGRLDATNLFMPNVCAITTIGLDHVKTLGPTEELIAAEKAGIIKKGIPVVLGNISPAPLKVITDIANAKEAPYYLIGRDFAIQNIQNSIEGISFDYLFRSYEFVALQSNLIGEHQATNLAVALTAFILYLEDLGIEVNESLIRKALGQINWKGRMQLLQREPYVLLDGAHNMQGIKALAHNLKQIFPEKRIRYVVSILADKDYPHMLQALSENAEILYIAQNSSDRAATLDQQASVLNACRVPYKAAISVTEAFNRALSEAANDDVIVCGGSLYTVGEILSLYK